MPYLPASMRAEDLKPLGPPVRPAAAVAGPCQHQWVPVPDSKVHSRCANCGVVTLTEMVHVPPAPKPAPAPQALAVWPLPLPLGFTPGKPPPDTRVDLCFADGSIGYDYASNLTPMAEVTGWRPAHPAFSPHTRYVAALNACLRKQVDMMAMQPRVIRATAGSDGLEALCRKYGIKKL